MQKIIIQDAYGNEAEAAEYNDSNSEDLCFRLLPDYENGTTLKIVWRRTV